jgi:hypothetical protein
MIKELETKKKEKICVAVHLGQPQLHHPETPDHAVVHEALTYQDEPLDHPHGPAVAVRDAAEALKTNAYFLTGLHCIPEGFDMQF